MRTPLLENLLEEIVQEIGRAKRKHPDCPTLHHAIAVIREEYLELEHEIFVDNKDRAAIDKEAIQLAATCIRLIMDVNLDSREG